MSHDPSYQQYGNAPQQAPWPPPPLPSPGQNPFSDQPQPAYGIPAGPNPYAPPAATPDYVPTAYKPASWEGLWRQGKLLVMHHRAPLPDVCLKSNQPCKRRLKRNLAWHHWSIYLLILLHLLIYLVVALMTQKKATIYIGLSDEWFARRRRTIIIAWSLILMSVAMFVAGITLLDQVEWSPILLIVSMPLGLGAALWGLIRSRLVTPKRMTDEFVWLKGVHPDFLARLPEWPYAI